MKLTRTARTLSLFAVAMLGALGCGSGNGEEEIPEPVEQACVSSETNGAAAAEPDFLASVGCKRDFELLASAPLDASIPGARSVKVVFDIADGGKLYFQNSKRYKIHWEFASKHLSGRGKPIVPPLMQFNQTEYFSPSRRFLLGSITFYEGPRIWAFEIAPYDTASAPLITRVHEAIVRASYFGAALTFHPTSSAVEVEAKKLSGVRVRTTDQLFAKIAYQPLNLATGVGKLRFLRAADLDKEYVSFRDILVLDRVPNDISVTTGLITEEFQTPLSHVNVLSQNRGTPNMALREAHGNPRLRALDGKWVRLTVGPFEYKIEEVSAVEAEAWWQMHKPTAVQIAKMDTSVMGLPNVETLVDTAKLKESLKAAIPAFGGKATHYGAMYAAKIAPMAKGFAIPVRYYAEFMRQNGFDATIDALLKNEAFRTDVRVRDQRLEELREAMHKAPVDPAFAKLLDDKIKAEYPGIALRFRSSTNAEDLEGFTGAGLYTSKRGDPNDPTKPYLEAVRKVWASVWRLRAFDEREYRSVDHKSVGMAILVHQAWREEEASGIAVTANPFDTSGLQPGFYVNVQVGNESVALPEAGVKADQFVYHYDAPGKPIVFLEHSTLVPKGKTVLTARQTFELGKALTAIHEFFRSAYGPPPEDPRAWYGLEVDFKFDGNAGEEPALWIKQARPHPGRGR